MQDLWLLYREIHQSFTFYRQWLKARALIAFTFEMLLYNFLYDLLRQLTPLLVHVQSDTHIDTKQESDYF